MATKSNQKLREEAERISNEIEYKKQANAAFVDGIIGLFIFHLIFGIIAIVRANKAMQSEDPVVVSKAKSGKTLGIIAIVAPFALFLFGAILGTIANM